MAQRRGSDPAFGSDSFLDVVANLVGIVLIIIVLVGARIRELPDLAPPGTARLEVAPPTDEQSAALTRDIGKLESELARLQERLLDTLRAFDLVTTKSAILERQRAEAQAKAKQVEVGIQRQDQESAALSQALSRLETERRSLEERIAQLRKGIQELENAPPDRRVLRFHLPVSRPVSDGELLFELRGNRAAFVDLQSFIAEVKQKLPQKVELLRRQWEASDTTEPVGAFRMRYTVARDRTSGLDHAFTNLPPTEERGFSYALDSWTIEPILPVRGETLADALAEESLFRRVVDRADPDQVVLTFFVYTDSFEVYRQLRDWLYERGFQVAGRPMAADRLINGSRSGTLSRGQ
jgi:chaperonin cofactor prefoldin